MTDVLVNNVYNDIFLQSVLVEWSCAVRPVVKEEKLLLDISGSSSGSCHGTPT